MRHLIKLILLLSLAACGSNPNGNGGAVSAGGHAPDQSAGALVQPRGNSIGTQGGGGTVVFAFRQGALLAKRAMETSPELTLANPNNDRVNAFYKQNRARWIQALETFVSNPKIIAETADALSENGLAVGALSLPEARPDHVLLSVPYLTVRDGFTEDKAFALAVHEAGHFALAPISSDDHVYLDQIASMLRWKSQSRSKVQREYRFENPGDASFRTPFMSSDGRQLVYSTDRYQVRWLDVESGLVHEERAETSTTGEATRLIDGDWSTHYDGEGHLVLRNSVTRQQIPLEGVNHRARFEISKDGKTLAIHEERKIELRNLLTGERRSVERFADRGFVSKFDESYHVEAQSDHGRVAVYDLTTGDAIDLIRNRGTAYETYLLNSRLLLVQWWTGVGGDQAVYELRNIGEAKPLATVRSWHYIGRQERNGQLLFIQPDGNGLVQVDVSTYRQKNVLTAPLERVLCFGSCDNGLVYDNVGGMIWTAGPNDLDLLTPISLPSQPEKVIGAFQTDVGRVLVTNDLTDGKLVVRYLDR